MEQSLLRLLIQEKLADGRLPHTFIPRAGGGAGHGQTCDGCGEAVTYAQTVMGNLDAAACGLQFHVACFYVWDVERQVSGPEPSARLPAHSALRAPSARPNRPWAPSAPSGERGTMTRDSGERGDSIGVGADRAPILARMRPTEV